MPKQIVVHNTDELDKYKITILDNLNSSVNMLQQVLNDNDALIEFEITVITNANKHAANTLLSTKKAPQDKIKNTKEQINPTGF